MPSIDYKSLVNGVDLPLTESSKDIENTENNVYALGNTELEKYTKLSGILRNMADQLLTMEETTPEEPVGDLKTEYRAEKIEQILKNKLKNVLHSEGN
jgi:hypothetical protein